MQIMSFNEIEMQMAISRTHQTQQVQLHMMRKPEQDQQILGEQAVLSQQEQALKPVNVEGADQRGVDRGGEESGGGGQEADSEHSDRKPDDRRPRQADHPYKGKHIDLSL